MKSVLLLLTGLHSGTPTTHRLRVLESDKICLPDKKAKRYTTDRQIYHLFFSPSIREKYLKIILEIVTR